MRGGIVPFPPQLRVVRAPVDWPSPEQVEPVLVDHGGRTYRLADLMAPLSTAELEQVEAAPPRSGQEAWDLVVRRWPALAEEIVAGCDVVRR